MTNVDQALSPAELLLFVTGVFCGDVAWFSFLNWMLSHLEKNSQERTLKTIRLSVGVIFIALGFVGLGSYAFK